MDRLLKLLNSTLLLKITLFSLIILNRHLQFLILIMSIKVHYFTLNTVYLMQFNCIFIIYHHFLFNHKKDKLFMPIKHGFQ